MADNVFRSRWLLAGRDTSKALFMDAGSCDGKEAPILPYPFEWRLVLPPAPAPDARDVPPLLTLAERSVPDRRSRWWEEPCSARGAGTRNSSAEANVPEADGASLASIRANARGSQSTAGNRNARRSSDRQTMRCCGRRAKQTGCERHQKRAKETRISEQAENGLVVETLVVRWHAVRKLPTGLSVAPDGGFVGESFDSALCPYSSGLLWTKISRSTAPVDKTMHTSKAAHHTMPSMHTNPAGKEKTNSKSFRHKHTHSLSVPAPVSVFVCC